MSPLSAWLSKMRSGAQGGISRDRTITCLARQALHNQLLHATGKRAQLPYSLLWLSYQTKRPRAVLSKLSLPSSNQFIFSVYRSRHYQSRLLLSQSQPELVAMLCNTCRPYALKTKSMTEFLDQPWQCHTHALSTVDDQSKPVFKMHLPSSRLNFCKPWQGRPTSKLCTVQMFLHAIRSIMSQWSCMEEHAKSDFPIDKSRHSGEGATTVCSNKPSLLFEEA